MLFLEGAEELFCNTGSLFYKDQGASQIGLKLSSTCSKLNDVKIFLAQTFVKQDHSQNHCYLKDLSCFFLSNSLSYQRCVLYLLKKQFSVLQSKNKLLHCFCVSHKI